MYLFDCDLFVSLSSSILSILIVIALQWFLIFTCIIVVVLAILGFTHFKDALPINDKILHFLCFCWVTFVFYFIVDVDEYVLPNVRLVVNSNLSVHLQRRPKSVVLEIFAAHVYYLLLYVLWRNYNGSNSSRTSSEL